MSIIARQGRVARVLVVDDSVVVRTILARALESESSLELAGVAANGRIAIQKVDRLTPDVVILDLEMPEMDGFATLAAIRRTHPDLPVIIFSNLTSEGATATLEALALGATDFVLKPSAAGIGLAEAQVRAQLLPLVSAVTAPMLPPSDFTPSAVSSTTSPSAWNALRAPKVSAVVIAASTGGPNALADVALVLPKDLAVPVFIVQHMPPIFTKMLAERLDRVAAVSVVEATAGDVVVPGRVYVAPGGHHLALLRAGEQVTTHITDAPPENSCRPAADVLFRAAAQIYGPGVLAVVLTGMGRDGLRGSEAVKAAGGSVLAQSAKSAVVASMPAAITAAGLADAVASLEDVGTEILGRIARGR